MYSKVFQASFLLALTVLIQIGAEKPRVPSEVNPNYTDDEIDTMFKEAYANREYWGNIFNKMRTVEFQKNPVLNEDELGRFEALARKKLNRFNNRLEMLRKYFDYKPSRDNNN